MSSTTYANINYLHQEQMRTQIQQQLTRMVGAQALFVLFGMIAYTTQTIYTLLTMYTPKSTLRQAQESVGLTITGVLSYIGYAFNFYIYMTVSPSLRKQFKQLIKKYLRYLICLNHCTIDTNRTAPCHSTRNTFQPHLIQTKRPQQLVPVKQ
ncbi:unnamed protein product [Didymodactylos carnosus]|uniref:Uncharacterized protein n=1 Tax=Didymodactylos carnosus TaxID=1234261 RepID=A0A814QJN5_9BILA|nr:unnamed protein product [Didymodactylos carnosus]CAF3884328.1 unnamed protein product [Didymodactylos carnosus]